MYNDKNLYQFLDPKDLEEKSDPAIQELSEFIAQSNTRPEEIKQNYTTNWLKIIDKTLIKKI